MQWEIEKRDAIIEQKDQEIRNKQSHINDLIHRRDKLDREFKEYVKKGKQAKVDSEKIENQRLKIIELTTELEETKKRLQARNRMVEILEKQQRKLS